MRDVIKQIFVDNYDEFREENKHRIRKVCDDEAKKLMRCKDINYGRILYECPNCGEQLQVGFTVNYKFKIYQNATILSK